MWLIVVLVYLLITIIWFLVLCYGNRHYLVVGDSISAEIVATVLSEAGYLTKRLRRGYTAWRWIGKRRWPVNGLSLFDLQSDITEYPELQHQCPEGQVNWLSTVVVVDPEIITGEFEALTSKGWLPLKSIDDGALVNLLTIRRLEASDSWHLSAMQRCTDPIAEFYQTLTKLIYLTKK